MDDYITLQEAIAITGHTDTTQLRRAAERWAAGDKTGLQAKRLHARLWVTKRPWVERWENAHRKERGWPKGEKRPPRRPASEETQ